MESMYLRLDNILFKGIIMNNCRLFDVEIGYMEKRKEKIWYFGVRTSLLYIRIDGDGWIADASFVH